MFIFEYDHPDWLSQFHSEWRQTSKLVNFLDFCEGPSMRSVLESWKSQSSVPFIKKGLVNHVYIWSS